MRKLFYIDKDDTVCESPYTPEREKLIGFYPSRKEALKALYRRLFDQADEIIAKRDKVRAELILIVEKEYQNAWNAETKQR